MISPRIMSRSCLTMHSTFRAQFTHLRSTFGYTPSSWLSCWCSWQSPAPRRCSPRIQVPSISSRSSSPPRSLPKVCCSRQNFRMTQSDAKALRTLRLHGKRSNSSRVRSADHGELVLNLPADIIRTTFSICCTCCSGKAIARRAAIIAVHAICFQASPTRATAQAVVVRRSLTSAMTRVWTLHQQSRE
jgi:hypothetical protein